MSDPLGGFRPRGALLVCLMSFPQFRDDLGVLSREGYAKVTGSETCDWLKSKTSLAEYFKWTGGDAEWVSGGFWAPIENTFGIKRHTLRKLSGHNANSLKPEESRDIINIKPIIEKHRAQEKKSAEEKGYSGRLKSFLLKLRTRNQKLSKEFWKKYMNLFKKMWIETDKSAGKKYQEYAEVLIVMF
jgi:hypothetical protein